MPKLEKFRELGLSEDIINALRQKGFEEPTPIQAKTIPYIINSTKDLIGKASTGTGKTAAFGLPLIQNITPNSGKIQALIMAPTRELAIQVTEELSSFCLHNKLKIIPIYGGQPIDRQISRLERGVDIVVGTPGRLIDHINRKTMDISQVSYVVLDEADEMLNMGFVEDIESILESTPKTRRTILFSATMPKHIQNLAKTYMKEYELIEIEKKDNDKKNIKQIYFEVNERDKFETLFRIIDLEETFYGLVFCRTKVDSDEIATKLSNRGLRAEALHGDLSQGQREKILTRFRGQKINILVATDVAARGIDVENLTHVINYAIPQDPESYVHRIGRTGRAGKEGTAITLVTPSEFRKLNIIEKMANATINKQKIPNIQAVIENKKQRILASIIGIMGSQSSEDLQLAEEIIDKVIAHNFEDLEEKEVDVKTGIIAALIKIYAKNEFHESGYQEISDSKKSSSRDKVRSDRDDRGGREGRNNDYDNNDSGDVRLFFAQGKNSGMDPRQLVEFIQERTGVSQNRINDVKILDEFSFFATPKEDASKILDFFQQNSQDGRSLVSKAKSKTPSTSGDRGFRNEGGRGNDRGDFRRRDSGRDAPRADMGRTTNGGFRRERSDSSPRGGNGDNRGGFSPRGNTGGGFPSRGNTSGGFSSSRGSDNRGGRDANRGGGRGFNNRNSQ